MPKTKKQSKAKRAVLPDSRAPTADYYRELIRKVDMMLQEFQDAKSKVGSEWYWWSLTIYALWDITDPIERAETIWRDKKEWAAKVAAFTERKIHQKSVYFGNASTFNNDDEFTAYFATSEDGTNSEFLKIRQVAESAVKALRIFYPPKCEFALSQYLDGSVRARNWRVGRVYIDISRAAWCWFEFVYNMSFEIGSPLLYKCFELPVVYDCLPNYVEFAQKPPYYLDPELRILQHVEPRFHPEVRLIEHEICEASILALQFLRNAAISKRDQLQQSTKTESEKALQNKATKDSGGKVGATKKSKKKLKPLSKTAAAVYELLKDLPEHRGLKGREILEELERRDKPIFIDQSTLTKNIIPALRPYGVKNKRGAGYFISE